MNLRLRPALAPIALSVALVAPFVACSGGDDGGGAATTVPEAGLDAMKPTGDAGIDASHAGDASTNDSAIVDATPDDSAADASDANDAGIVDASHQFDNDGAPETLADAGDYGSDSSTYPAFAVDTPQVVANQGAVLTKPVIVTITWPGDPSVSTWEAYGDTIGASSYWAATTAEYGVGPATSGAANHVHLTQAAANIDYDALTAFVATNVAAAESDAGSAWPAPTMDAQGDVQTIYSLFIPQTMSVTSSGSTLCDIGYGGYHDDVLVKGKPVPFAVNLNCKGFTPATTEEYAAHEYVEAATNPYPSYPNVATSAPTDLGYVNFDDGHIAWEVYKNFGQPELADKCIDWPDSFGTESGSFPYGVQHSWSNEAARAGHNPCAPEPSAPYFGVTLFPSQESTITVDLGLFFGPTQLDTVRTTKGFHAVVGQSVTFQVGFFSDASAEPWTIAYDLDHLGAGNNGAATVVIDQPTGQNGHKAYVTFTPTKAGPSGFQLLNLTWNPPAPDAAPYSDPRYLPILILNQ